MSIDNLQSIAATTGQFQALSTAEAGGSSPPEGGKAVPVEAVKKPDLDELVESLNKASRAVGRDLRFEVDLGSRRAVIQVLDSETGEIIRQIPPEKADVYLSDGGEVSLRLLDASA